jgi:hypothetical protein
MKRILSAPIGFLVFLATQHAFAQNRQAIVTGGDVPTPAGGSVIVTGGAPPIPPVAAAAISNQNRLGTVAGSGFPGPTPSVTTVVTNGYTVGTNHAPAMTRATNSSVSTPVQRKPQ